LIRKGTWQAENPFMIKIFNKLGTAGTWSGFYSYYQFWHHLPAGSGRRHTLRAQFYKTALQPNCRHQPPVQANAWASDPQISSIQSLSCVQLFATLWTAAHQVSLSITNSQSLLKLKSIELVMPSNHLILCRPLLLLPSIFPSIGVFSNESVLRIRWPKYWSFSIGPSNEYSGLISCRTDWFDLLAVQGPLKSLHYSWQASILWCSAFFMVLLSHTYITTGKTIPLTRWTFVSKATSLLFNMLSRFDPQATGSQPPPQINLLGHSTELRLIQEQAEARCTREVWGSPGVTPRKSPCVHQLESLGTPSFWGFMEASLQRHDRLNHWPLEISSSCPLPLPGGQVPTL